MFEKWITNGTAAPFYARRAFPVSKEVAHAEVRVCGLGQFILHLNGKKVGDHELDPAWTNYSRLVQYVTFDVTEELHPGRCAVGVEVGNGWYHRAQEHYTFSFPPFMPPNPNGYRPFAKVLVLALELSVTYRDGTQETLAADESFRVRTHPTVMSNVYGSETIDLRLDIPGWDEEDFDDSDWEYAQRAEEEAVPKGELQDQFQPPVRVIRTYEGKFLCRVNGRDIYDFAQNMAGILDFEVRGKAGDCVKICPAEKRGPDGDIDPFAKGWTLVDSCETVTVGKDDTWQHVRMKFTYFAGRFAAVEKIPACEGGPLPEIRALRADAVSSAVPSGSFSCDEERFQKVYDMVVRSVEANLLSVHTDCPTIERFAWQETNHLMAPSIFYLFDGEKLWEKFFLDMRTCQHTEEDWFSDGAGGRYYPGEGTMPAQCPCYDPNVLPVPGLGDMYDIIAWGSTIILGPFWHYLFYGDETVLSDNFEAGARFLRHTAGRVNGEGFINCGLGDWGNPRGDYARENIETAFLYADALLLGRFAGILAKQEEEKALLAFAQRVLDHYNETLLRYDEERGFWCYPCRDHPGEIYLTQASQALPLFWGMVPPEREADVVRAFRWTLERDGCFLSGEVGLPYVIETARRYGMNDLISRFALREEHPGYYAFILDGETTLGEYWEKNPRSHCHDMLGHIVQWYYDGIAGIIPEEPGFRAVRICPYLPEGMHTFSCTHQSVGGEITVRVREEEREILLEVSADRRIKVRIDASNLEGRQKPVRVRQIRL